MPHPPPYLSLLDQRQLPHIWCPGCGLGLMLRETAITLEDLKFTPKNTAIVSGIGCTGRAAGYFAFDSVHTTHGRALCVAEGLKHAQPKHNVVVFSGDGDLLGIGGNHFLHVSRRNPNLAVLCYDNEIYGLTGGQVSPETELDTPTLTTPKGNPFPPINPQGILMSNDRYFFARTSVYHHEHFRQVLKAAIKWPGFAFINVMGYCIENDGRRRGFKFGYQMLEEIKKEYVIRPDVSDQPLKDNELGIVQKK